MAEQEHCQIVDVDGEPVRVHGNLTTAEDQAAFAEVVRAARRRLEAEDRAPQFRAFLGRLERWNRHHPRPLCIDGQAYRRRVRSRRRRR